MKSSLLALLIFLVASTGSLSQTVSQCKEVSQDIAALRSFHPRLEASPGDAETQSYIMSRLTALGLEAERRTIGAEVDAHSFSAIVETVIQGGSEDTLVVVAPLNHPPGAPRRADGSSALAAALQLARIYADNPPPLTLRIVFPGADHGDRALGSEALVERLEISKELAVLYLGSDLSGGSYSLRTASREQIAPRWLVEYLARTLRAKGLRVSLSLARTQAARAGRAGEETPIARYMARGIPAVALVDQATGAADASPGDADTTAAAICELTSALADLVETYQTGLPRSWDRHYIFYSSANRLIFLGETGYVLALLIIILGTLLYGLLFRGRLTRYLRTFGRNFFNLPVIFLVIFGVLTLSGVILDRIAVFRDFPSLWTHYPIIFFATKLLLAALFYLILHRLLLSTALSRNGSYYSASALASLFLGILVLATIDISTTPYFLWAFVFAFFFSVLRPRLLKVLTFLASIYLLGQFTWTVFQLPLELVASSLVSSSSQENLLMAVAVLPFLLMLIRVDFLFRKGPLTGHGGVAITILALFLTAGLAGTGYLTFAWPFDDENPQPVEMIETIDRPEARHTVVFESEAPLGSFDVTFGEELLAVQTDDRRLSVQITDAPELVTLSLEENRFLNRSRRRLTIDSRIPLSDLEVSLTGDEQLIILDANFPVEEIPAENRLRFRIGPSPPTPLLVDYTLPAAAQAEVRIEGRSRSLSREFMPDATDIRLEPRLLLRRVLED